MVVLPACSFPPTVLFGFLVQLCDELDQQLIQLGKKNNTETNNKEGKVGNLCKIHSPMQFLR